MHSCLTHVLTAITVAITGFMGLFALGRSTAVTTEISALEPLPLVNTYDQSPMAFSFRYPDDWLVFVPEQGLLILGPAAATQSQAIPTLTVLRSQRLSSEVNSLDEAMTVYLRRGPMLPDQAWEIVTEISPTTIAGREALMVELEGANRAGDPEQHILALVTRAENDIVYIFAVGAPLADWPLHAPTLRAILDSVIILE